MFAATVTVPVTVNLTGYAPQFGWCGVAIDRLPRAVEMSAFYALYGTAPFIIQTHPTNSSSTISRDTKGYDNCIYGLADATGCPVEVIPPMPAISGFTASTTTICAGQSVTLTANATNAQRYSFDNGANWQTAATKTVSPLTTTTYVLKATRTAGACTVTYPTQLTVTVRPVPELEFVNPPACIAPNSEAMLTVNDKNSAAGSYCFTYECTDCTHNGYLTGNNEAAAVGCYWHSECVYGTANTCTVTMPDAGTLTVWAKAITAYGCTDSVATTITTLAGPTGLALTATPDVICAGEAVTLTASADGAASYSIDGVNWQTGNTFTQTPASPKTYTLYVQSAAGCMATRANAATVTMRDPPVISTVNPVARCGAGDVTLSATVTSGDTPAMTYTWVVGGGAAQMTTANTLTVSAPAGSTTYSVTATNANGCTGAAESGTITVHTAVGAATIAGAAGNTCPANVNVALTASAAGATTFTWYKGGSQVQTGTSSAYTVTSSGSYTVQGKNANCTGTASASKVVTITSISNCVPGCTNLNLKLYQINTPTDGNGTYADANANAFCTDSKRKARVPNDEELRCMCNNRKTMPGGSLVGISLWSSTGNIASFNNNGCNIGATLSKTLPFRCVL